MLLLKKKNFSFGGGEVGGGVVGFWCVFFLGGRWVLVVSSYFDHEYARGEVQSQEVYTT